MKPARDIAIVAEAELRRLVPLDHDAIACVEQAFRALATVPVAMPPILRLEIPEFRGEVDVKTAYVPGMDSFAVKISPGFFDNPKLGLPSVNGLMVVFESRTGLVKAVLLDNGYLTDVRTAAAGAVAARCLSREESEVAAVYGAGTQARLQLEALTLVRPIRQARIWARDPSKAAVAARDLSARLGFPVTAEPDPARAADGADVVITTTPSTEPIFKASWARAGLHITAVGADAEHKQELETGLVAAAHPYVADRLSQTRRLGELHHAISAGIVPEAAHFVELGEVLISPEKGRASRDAVTIADLTGTGVQDTAISALALARHQS